MLTEAQEIAQTFAQEAAAGLYDIDELSLDDIRHAIATTGAGCSVEDVLDAVDDLQDRDAAIAMGERW